MAADSVSRLPPASYGSQADDHKPAQNDPPIIATSQAKTLHNDPVVSSADSSPRKEAQQQAPRKRFVRHTVIPTQKKTFECMID